MRRMLIFVCILLVPAACAKPSNPAATLDAARVASIRAEINHTPDDGPTIDLFEAAREDLPRLLDLCKDGVVEPIAAVNWLAFGQIKITTTDGKTTTVDFYWTGAQRGAYRVNGVPVRGSTDKAFRETIADCAKRGKKL